MKKFIVVSRAVGISPRVDVVDYGSMVDLYVLKLTRMSLLELMNISDRLEIEEIDSIILSGTEFIVKRTA